MAVMSSHQLEGAILDHKIQAKMASDVEQKVNGVNGHPSPTPPKDIVPDEAQSAATSPPGAVDPVPTADSLDRNGKSTLDNMTDDNTKAFATNQDLLEKGTAMDVDEPKVEQVQVKAPESDGKATSDIPEDKPAPKSAPEDDTVMEDVAPPTDDHNEESDGVKHDQNEGEITSTGDIEMKDAPEPESEPATIPAPASSPKNPETDQPATAPTAASTENLEPESQPTIVQDLTSSADHPMAESTQDTSIMSDAEVPQKLVEMALSPKDNSLAPPSVSEPPKSPAKVSRERDDDNIEEPPTKRARTDNEHATDAVGVSQPSGSNPAEADAAPEAVVGDHAPGAEPDVKRDDWKRYEIPGHEGEQLTASMVKEAKKAIAGIKKTKVGGQLSKPVEVTWPTLAPQYNAVITRPMNFGLIDTKLKEGQYATLAELKEEVDLVYGNAIDFNGPSHAITSQAHGYVERVMIALKTAGHDKPRTGRKDATVNKPPPRPKHQAPPPPPPAREARHTEPKAPQKHSRRDSHATVAPIATSPAPSKADESPTFAVPPSGMPLIRRDSTKDGKRPIHPPKNKDLDYSNKGQKKKLSVELKFYEDILKELRSAKHSNLNGPFLVPVDPVALNIPTYFNLIKKPMDLSVLATKLETGECKRGKDFEADMSLMFKNCFRFNPAGNVIHDIGKQFESVYKALLAKKDAWMKDNAPPPAPPKTNRAPLAAADSDESEPEAEVIPEVAQDDDSLRRQQETVKLLDGRVKEESKKLTEELGKPVPNESIMKITQLLINTLMQELLQEKKKLAEMIKLPGVKSKTGKTAKAKSGAAAQKRAAAPKKPAANKKSAKKRRPATELQREVVTDGILQLDETNMNRCIEIIKRDTNQTENDSGELELDITVLTPEAVWKLFEIIKTKLPDVADARLQGMEVEREPTPVPEPSPTRQIAKAAKPKKNKPMNKQEQERKIEQLKELKAQFRRGGSGSQEPIPSVEDQANDDSSDEEPSDSEEE